MSANRVLVVEDEQVIRHVLSTYLESLGFEACTAGSGEDALPLIQDPTFDVAMVDLVLPGMHGLKVLEAIKAASPDTEVILMTSHASVDTAAQAIRSGAYDYLLKPFQELDEIGDTVNRALEKRRLTLQNRALLEDLATRNSALSAAVRRRDTLNEAGRAINALTDVPQLLDYLLGLLSTELQVDRASLMLWDDATEELYIACARGIPADVVAGTRVKIGDGIAGKVAATRERLLVNDLKSCPDLVEVPRPDLSNSFVCSPMTVSVPIKSAAHLLGVISLTNRRIPDPFTDEDMHLLESLADQAAVAIERGKYIRELEEALSRIEATQRQLVSAERLKALGEMAAGVAHDFNNIMDGILMRAERLLGKLSGPEIDREGFRHDLQVVARLVHQGSSSVRSLQDFTRIRKDQPVATILLNDVVREAVELTKHYWRQRCEAAGCKVDVSLDLGASAPVRGVSTELVQVVSNLVFNSIEAMPDGGVIDIRTHQDGDSVILAVSDSGIGMSNEVRERMFEPFFTTKENGHGLGSSISYGIIQRHGGEITVESEPGKGTRFEIRLPTELDSIGSRADSQPALPNSSPVNQGQRRVLVVDDDELVLEAHRTVLEDQGYVVVTAGNGEEALKEFEADPFDVVLTDLGMPVMGGWDLSRRVRALSPQVRVILLSGWGIQENQAEAREAGVDLVLSKPCHLVDLLAAVEQVLRDPTAQAPAGGGVIPAIQETKQL